MIDTVARADVGTSGTLQRDSAFAPAVSSVESEVFKLEKCKSNPDVTHIMRGIFRPEVNLRDVRVSLAETESEGKTCLHLSLVGIVTTRNSYCFERIILLCLEC